MYILERCSVCTLVWQRFAPGDELLAQIYQSWEGDHAGLDRQDNVGYHRSIAEEVLLVLELVGRAPSDVTVLDFGMGWGRWSRMAVAFGCRSYGIERAGPQVEFARSQGVGLGGGEGGGGSSSLRAVLATCSVSQYA